LQEEVSQDRVY